MNGEPRSFEPGVTLLDLVRALGLEPARVAIELNRTIVPRESWATAIVETGSAIEIVQFVGGG